MGHVVAQSDKKRVKEGIGDTMAKEGEVVTAVPEIEVKIGVAEELKDMVGHIHACHLNGRLDHASIKEDALRWTKRGGNKLEIVFIKRRWPTKMPPGKKIKDSAGNICCETK